jgi:hypothetical protein
MTKSRKIRGAAFVTNNSKHFLTDAVAFDYDIIALEDLQRSEDRQGATSKQSGGGQGQLLLKIHSDGSFTMRQLTTKGFMPEAADEKIG